MHSLDIATTGSCLQNRLGPSRIHRPCPFRGNTSDLRVSGKEKRSCSVLRVYFQTPRKPNFNHWLDVKKSLHAMAVATFEKKVVTHSKNGPAHGYSLESDTNISSQGLLMLDDDSAELDDREKLRRQRISNANKGNVPWNKGRKHSAETLRRIRERTRLAMQNPKVKMKLVNLGHAQSEETRIKIGAGVRMGWQRRREKLMVQESCCFQWQNLIAEASRKGDSDADELRWDSYKILDKQLKEEWLKSIEMRKSMPRSKGSKRAPKSPEQRKKISEAISAKWADPDYRSRVCTALAKYHGTSVGGKPRRKSGTEPSTVHRSSAMKSAESYRFRVMQGKGLEKVEPKPKKNKPPSYKDPLAHSKLEMIKKIRAERVTMETKQMEAMERARLLIAEAEKAAKALEPAALTSTLARASLLETRKLIAEATRSLEAVESGQLMMTERGNSDNSSSLESSGVIDSFEDLASRRNDIISDRKEVNGTPVLSSKNNNSGDLKFAEIAPQNVVNGREQLTVTHGIEGIPSHVSRSALAENETEWPQTKYEAEGVQESEGADKNDKLQPEYVRGASNSVKVGTSIATATKKKWVCGRLVEVVEE